VKPIGRRTGDFLGHGLADDCNPLEWIGIVKNSTTFLRVAGPSRVISAGAAKESGSSKASSESGIFASQLTRKGPLFTSRKDYAGLEFTRYKGRLENWVQGRGVDFAALRNVGEMIVPEPFLHIFSAEITVRVFVVGWCFEIGIRHRAEQDLGLERGTTFDFAFKGGDRCDRTAGAIANRQKSRNESKFGTGLLFWTLIKCSCLQLFKYGWENLWSESEVIFYDSAVSLVEVSDIASGELQLKSMFDKIKPNQRSWTAKRRTQSRPRRSETNPFACPWRGRRVAKRKRPADSPRLYRRTPSLALIANIGIR
jgi:hypothetical protein